jgi:hypothetical protein
MRRGAISVLAAAAVAGLTLSASPNGSASTTPEASDRSVLSSPATKSPTSREQKGFFDSRDVTASGTTAPAERALKGAHAPADVKALRTSLGSSAIVDIDPLTGTPRNLSALDRYLTGSSRSSARSIALSYVSSHLAQLGLSSSDLSTLRLRRDYVDTSGSHHLSWTQSARGVPVFGNGLEAHVTKRGQLIAIQGSPISGLADLTAGRSTTPSLSAASARSKAATDLGSSTVSAAQRTLGKSGGSSWSNGDTAQPVWFVTPAGARLAWDTYTKTADGQVSSHVVDARTGSVLYRRSLVNNDRGDAKVIDYYPGAAKGGHARVVNFIKKGWLPNGATWLQGRNVNAWADLNDDNLVNSREKTPVPGTPRRAQFTLDPFNGANPQCSSQFVCTWNPNQANSWKANKKADVTNAFFLANKFHDYLAQNPIGFTAAAGNFERADGDPVNLNALDGADTDNGLPDGNHIDNANMNTPPDGTPPTMQMYLWHAPGATPAEDPFIPVSGAFDASILYHEYTHGLSNRLVVDAQGNSTLNSIQAGSMGEAWSDWYAMDYLVASGLQPDSRAKDGQLRMGKYTLGDQFPFRTMALDCKVGSQVKSCQDPITGDFGGYTYGDFPQIGGAPEVHSSGEVWAQTLWDLREAVGHKVADTLVTRGMELSANDPSMLDMRNAIVQADKVVYTNAHTNVIWKVFANRGMGWYAGAIDGGDSFPAEDFHRPPAPSRGVGTLFGLVTDRLTGDPVEGTRVTVTGHPGYTDTTGSNGVYQIDFVKPGRYQKVVAAGNGYEVIVKKIRVTNSTSGTRTDFSTRRDWASSEGGGQITDFNGPDFTPFGCGPEQAIDLGQGQVWGSTTGDDDGTPTNTMIPKFIIVELPEAIDITTDTGNTSAFKVDPTAGCGDPGSASTGDFTIEVSSSATGPWTEVVNVDGDDTADPAPTGWLPRFTYTNLAASQAVADVSFVRLTLRSPQVPDFATNCPDGPFGGCEFTDFTELEVFGEPS